MERGPESDPQPEWIAPGPETGLEGKEDSNFVFLDLRGGFGFIFLGVM